MVCEPVLAIDLPKTAGADHAPDDDDGILGGWRLYEVSYPCSVQQDSWMDGRRIGIPQTSRTVAWGRANTHCSESSHS